MLSRPSPTAPARPDLCPRPGVLPRRGGRSCTSAALIFFASAVVACASTTPAPTAGENPAASAAPGATAQTTENTDSSGPLADNPTTLPAPLLRGARCAAGKPSCECRAPDDVSESQPPPAGMKRLEVRLSFHGGRGSLASPSLGLLPAADVADTCYYLDVPAGSTHDLRFVGKANHETTGFTPKLAIAEYGEKGPFWYEVLKVDCVGVGGRCDKAGVEAWTASLRVRKRGRIDPCGSMVVTALKWDTSGGLAHRDEGYYRDLAVTFALEAKKFTPQFPPHSTECVPK